MITTVCMNPSFDKTASVSSMRAGEVNRIYGVRVDPGGKGLNVAIVLRRLNVEAQCVGCLGETGETTFMHLVEREKLPFSHITVPGEVRTNLKLYDEHEKTITEFNEPGISLNEEQFTDFLSLLKQKSENSKFVVLSGRLPENCAEDTYRRCIKTVEGRKCVLDASGDALLHGIKEAPYLVKPNLPEMEAIMKKELRTLRGIRDAALFLIEYGAQNVIVSMGKYGAVFTNGDTTLFAPALQVEARSTVGAGDAMIGGILMGLDRNEPIEDCIRYGVAAGAASVMTDGTQLIRKNDFDSLLRKVTVQEV